jgi:hypothetical protein
MVQLSYLLPMMCPAVPRKLRGHTQRNAHHTKKYDVREIPTQDVMRQGERK